MLLELLVWWYGSGWIDSWKRIGRWITGVQKEFSIDVLLSTLFAPWRQIVSLPGRSLEEKLKAVIDNLVSRTVGFFARLIVLLAALSLMAVAALVGLILALAWPLIPLAIIYCALRGVTG